VKNPAPAPATLLLPPQPTLREHLAAIGRRGGQSTSQAKIRAAQANAAAARAARQKKQKIPVDIPSGLE
jgi:hypothetical protein